MLRFESIGHLGLITLDRPAALHALDGPMIAALIRQLSAWQIDPLIHAVIIQAVPGKAFCAGGDIRWLYAQRGNLSLQLEYFASEYRLNQLIHEYPKPYIALMDGLTMGGGVGISLHGSHPIASERFVFAMPETAIGFFPDIGASYLLSRCPGALGVYLGLTGERLAAADAQDLVLVRAVVMAKNFPLLIQDLLESDLSKDACLAVDACVARYAVHLGSGKVLARQTALSDAFAPEDVALILFRLAASPLPWLQALHGNMLQKSPTSLAVARRQLALAKSLDLAGCLQLDGTLVRHFLQGHDFYEGVRAALIDKDKCPIWQPLCSAAELARYFV